MHSTTPDFTGATASSVRPDVTYENMTPEEQAVVRMWIKIGLDVEVAGASRIWVSLNAVNFDYTPIPGTVHGSPYWFYRLRPDTQA